MAAALDDRYVKPAGLGASQWLRPRQAAAETAVTLRIGASARVTWQRTERHGALIRKCEKLFAIARDWMAAAA